MQIVCLLVLFRYKQYIEIIIKHYNLLNNYIILQYLFIQASYLKAFVEYVVLLEYLSNKLI